MIDNLTEAISHAREVAKERNETANLTPTEYGDYINSCRECAKEHEQRAEWLEELAERREADRWIPVTERLPENDEYVLVYDNSDMFVAWFSKEFGWCSFDGNLDEYTPITHWRHLPKAPESEDK